jgi:hypothetical protein
MDASIIVNLRKYDEILREELLYHNQNGRPAIPIQCLILARADLLKCIADLEDYMALNQVKPTPK